MTTTRLYFALCAFMSLYPFIFWFVFRKPIDNWLRTIVQEEVSAVMGEDFPERDDKHGA